MAQPKSRRKELMPLAPTQLKFVTVVCLPLVLSCIIVSFWQTYFFLTSLRKSGAFTDDLSRQIFQTSILIAGMTLLVLVPVFILVAVWVSYRVVGPMRRLAAELRAVAEGRISGEFHFRRGDELGFVAEAVSGMERALLDKVEACRASLARAEAGEGAKEALAELRRRLDALASPPGPAA